MATFQPGRTRLEGIMRVPQRPIYPDGLVRTGCYLARGFVKGDGLEAATVIVVDGVQDGAGVGEDGECVSSNVRSDALAIPVSRRDSLEASFRLAWKDRLHTIGASRSRMALLGDRTGHDGRREEDGNVGKGRPRVATRTGSDDARSSRRRGRNVCRGSFRTAPQRLPV